MNAAVNGGRHARPEPHTHRKQPGQPTGQIRPPDPPPRWAHRQRLRLRGRDWLIIPVALAVAALIGAALGRVVLG